MIVRSDGHRRLRSTVSPPDVRRRLEGEAALREALDEGAAVRVVLARAGFRETETEKLLARVRASGIPVREESDREMLRMSAGQAPPAVIALVGPPLEVDLEGLMSAEGLVPVLVGLRYPGNVGFILRSAEVAGCAGVVVASDWGSAQWTAALRVGMRPERFMPIVRADAAAAVGAARRAGRSVLAVETSGAIDPWQADLADDPLLLVGSESEGLPATLLAEADAIVRIPTGGFVPSYNVQAAVGIVLGEWLRQTRAD